MSLLALGCSEAPPPVAAPAIVMVVIDTLRADHLGLYGYERPTSPELDRWAERGLVFERAYSSAPWTLPAVATLLTGRLPSAHRAGAITATTPRRTHAAMATDIPTLAERLAAQGWRTGAIVVNPFLDPRYGLDRGFETYEDMSGDRRGSRTARAVAHRAISWLEEHRDQRFFLLLHLIDPHKSYEAPRPFAGRFSAGLEGDPDPVLIEVREALERGETIDFEFLRAVYDEEIAYVDHQLGALRDYLDGSALSASTTVVVTSDHGEEFGDHAGFEHGHTLYDEVLRVPLIFWGPTVTPGRRSEPVSLTDVAATLLDAVGLDGGGELPGVSLLATAAGTAGTGTAAISRPLFAESMLYGTQRHAVVSWPWKLVMDAETGESRLHDLSRDPHEGVRLSPAADEPMARLAALLAGLDPVVTLGVTPGATPGATPQDATPRDEGVVLDEAALQRLRALGYVD